MRESISAIEVVASGSPNSRVSVGQESWQEGCHLQQWRQGRSKPG